MYVSDSILLNHIEMSFFFLAISKGTVIGISISSVWMCTNIFDGPNDLSKELSKEIDELQCLIDFLMETRTTLILSYLCIFFFVIIRIVCTAKMWKFCCLCAFSSLPHTLLRVDYK